VGGWWRTAQSVFGRAAPFFPHAYAPTWLLEGVAVHYETKIAGGGRLAGTEFSAYARALADDDVLPAIDAIVTPRPFFPGGNAPYIFGSFLVDATVRHDPLIGDVVSMQRLLRRMSDRANPWRHDASAREAVGLSFTAMFAAWQDSVRIAETGGADGNDAEVVQTLANHGWTARFPRFLPSGDVIYVADDRRRNPGLYHLDPRSRRTRVGRRNSVDANAPTTKGSRTVQGEFERGDPYSLFSDLYANQGFARRRLTRGARLTHPDVHPATGRIVAVQSVPGSTQLVTLNADGTDAKVLAAGSLDRNWSEPRWSRDGTRIAASSWELGGTTSIVILDQTGTELQRFSPRGRAMSITSAPAWVPGDTMIVFASDHEGRTSLYRGDVRTGAYARIWSTRTALNSPDVSADGSTVVAVELRADGYRVVARPMPGPLAMTQPTADTLRATPDAAYQPAPPPRLSRDTVYQAAETLRPTWWLPSSHVSDEGSGLFGVMSGGTDVIGRHRWQAALLRNVQRPEFSGGAFYTYAGLGNPTIAIGAQQDWAHTPVFNGGNFLGTLARRSTLFSTNALAVRPRARHSTYLLVGGELNLEKYVTYPWNLLNQFTDASFAELTAYPRIVTAVGVSTLQRPGLSVSTEDGIALNATHRARFKEGIDDDLVNEVVVTASAAKSVPLPGFSRHVLALRGAVGVVDDNSRSGFGIGGVSGSSIELLPGLAVGGESRTFFVRGFDGGVQRGVRAVAASAEYRAPLVRIGRGYRFLPVFLQKTSVLAFADAGAAWCDNAVPGSNVCEGPVPPRTIIASVGGELNIDASLLHEVLYRFRIGYARPIRGTALASQPATFYFTLGNTF